MDSDPYIIGGQDADENEWPWQVGFHQYFRYVKHCNVHQNQGYIFGHLCPNRCKMKRCCGGFRIYHKEGRQPQRWRRKAIILKIEKSGPEGASQVSL